MFFMQNSADTCLKMNYFGSKSQKLPRAGESAPKPPSYLWRLGALSPDPRLDSITRENGQDPTRIKLFWLIQVLGNFGAKRNLYFLTFLSKKRSLPLHSTTQKHDICASYETSMLLHNFVFPYVPQRC